MNLPVDVVSGPELQVIIEKLMATPSATVERMKALTQQ